MLLGNDPLTRAAEIENESPWLPAVERERERDQKIEAVRDMALTLFIEQGYHHVTMHDVAERLNVTKPALYNYFRGKEYILYSCWMSGYKQLLKRIENEISPSNNGLMRLQDMIRIYAETMTTTYGKSLSLIDERDLEPANRRKIRQCKRDLDRMFRSMIEAGVADGSIAPTDVKMAAFAIAGALNWIGHWHQPEGPMSAEAIGADFAIRLTTGLASGLAADDAKEMQGIAVTHP